MKYFDHAASSMITPDVLEVMTESFLKDFANPSAKHLLGYQLRERLECFRVDFLKNLKANADDHFYFTSSATESNNTVIRGCLVGEGDCVLYSEADHPSLVNPIKKLAIEKKLELKIIPLTAEGIIDQKKFEELLDSKTKLVLLSHVNSQSGVIQEIESLAHLVKSKTHAHVHVDAVQSFGKIQLPQLSSVDSLSITSHKIGGPKGVAGLYLKKGHGIQPLVLGGGQEEGMRGGTESFPLIVGFHQAMKDALKNLEQAFLRITEYSEMMTQELSRSLPIRTPFRATSPYIFSFILPGISSDIVVRHLEMKNLYISSTSACSSKISGFNSTLSALHIPEKFHKNILRVSMWQKTNLDEVEFLINEFKIMWNELKRFQKK